MRAASSRISLSSISLACSIKACSEIQWRIETGVLLWLIDSYLADTLYKPGASVSVPPGYIARQGGISDHHVLPARILHTKTELFGWPFFNSRSSSWSRNFVMSDSWKKSCVHLCLYSPPGSSFFLVLVWFILVQVLPFVGVRGNFVQSPIIQVLPSAGCNEEELRCALIKRLVTSSFIC